MVLYTRTICAKNMEVQGAKYSNSPTQQKAKSNIRNSQIC